MTLRLIVGALLLGCVWAKSIGDAGVPVTLERLVAVLVKKESRDLGESILKMIDDKSGTLHGILKRVVDDKELRGLVQKAVEGLNAVMGVADLGDVNGVVGLKAPTSRVANTEVENSTRTTKELTDDEEGRTFKRKKMMMRMALWMKTLFLGIGLPAAVGIALFAAWKGVTISLLALMLAGIVGLKGLVASASNPAASASPQHVILSGVPTQHQHYWKRSGPSSEHSSWGDDSHHLAYQAYTR